MNTKQKVIAIDGPSASGKGTVASRVAQALGFDYLDSGALYRLTALYAKKRDVEWNDEEAVAALAENLPARFEGTQVFWMTKTFRDKSAAKPSAWALLQWRSCRKCVPRFCSGSVIF